MRRYIRSRTLSPLPATVVCKLICMTRLFITVLVASLSTRTGIGDVPLPYAMCRSHISDASDTSVSAATAGAECLDPGVAGAAVATNAAGITFLAANKLKEGVVELSSGLQYKVGWLS